MDADRPRRWDGAGTSHSTRATGDQPEARRIIRLLAPLRGDAREISRDLSHSRSDDHSHEGHADHRGAPYRALTDQDPRDTSRGRDPELATALSATPPEAHPSPVTDRDVSCKSRRAAVNGHDKPAATSGRSVIQVGSPSRASTNNSPAGGLEPSPSGVRLAGASPGPDRACPLPMPEAGAAPQVYHLRMGVTRARRSIVYPPGGPPAGCTPGRRRRRERACVCVRAHVHRCCRPCCAGLAPSEREAEQHDVERGGVRRGGRARAARHERTTSRAGPRMRAEEGAVQRGRAWRRVRRRAPGPAAQTCRSEALTYPPPPVV